MLIDVFNQKNEKVDAADLPERIFGVKWNPDLVHQVLRVQLANKRKPWAHAKGRGEVRGGGRKPWKQKGTGRARHGSIRSPIWKGGGVSHGPKKEKKIDKKINKKMKRLAIFSLLSKKLKDREIKVLDSLKLKDLKSKNLAVMLKNTFGSKTNALIIFQNENKALAKAAANISKINTLSPYSLNVYDLLKNKYIVLEKGALDEIEKHYI